MSQQDQSSTNRTQPEWNAPLVSLPDISEILNGESPAKIPDTSQPLPAEQTSKSVASSHVAPDRTSLASETDAVNGPAPPVELCVAEQTTERPLEHETCDDFETEKQSSDFGVSVKKRATAILASFKESQIIRNGVVCAAAIAGTVVVLNMLDKPESRRPVAEVTENRQSLHGAPLAIETEDVPDEMTASVEEWMNELDAVAVDDTLAETTPTAAETDKQHGVSLNDGTRPELTKQADAQFATHSADQSGKQTLEDAASSYEQTVDGNLYPFADDPEDESTRQAYRKIQRYQPDEATVQPPHHQSMRGSQGPLQDSSSGPNGLGISPPVNRQRTSATDRVESPDSISPYYEQTTPDSFLYPENAIARAIDILRERARR